MTNSTSSMTIDNLAKTITLLIQILKTATPACSLRGHSSHQTIRCRPWEGTCDPFQLYTGPCDSCGPSSSWSSCSSSILWFVAWRGWRRGSVNRWVMVLLRLLASYTRCMVVMGRLKAVLVDESDGSSSSSCCGLLFKNNGLLLLFHNNDWLLEEETGARGRREYCQLLPWACVNPSACQIIPSMIVISHNFDRPCSEKRASPARSTGICCWSFLIFESLEVFDVASRTPCPFVVLSGISKLIDMLQDAMAMRSSHRTCNGWKPNNMKKRNIRMTSSMMLATLPHFVSCKYSCYTSLI